MKNETEILYWEDKWQSDDEGVLSELKSNRRNVRKGIDLTKI